MCTRVVNRIIPKSKYNYKRYSNKDSKCTTAGILVIGDEILKGQVMDTNSKFLAQELHKLGVKLKKISVVPDDIEDISAEVRLVSNKFDYILTTGGIGPTHDDLTYEAVAHAFGESIYLNSDLKEICMRFYKSIKSLNAGMKLAYIPKSSRLHYATVDGGRLLYPNVSVHNVYMFPGIPELLRKSFLSVGPVLFNSTRRFFSKVVYCTMEECEIVKELEILVQEFPEVEFGCYPKLYDSVYKVKVTIESCNEEATLKAYEKLLDLIPKNCIVNFDDL
ncbi:FAD synthase-like [Cylas formicarius]|uniref:FAD synthase-like n=1 Tax=Cylas formicarius TaxID=197179 RepID=UPI00295885A4|nr:FAD synthase-like [Cylas formicarius]